MVIDWNKNGISAQFACNCSLERTGCQFHCSAALEGVLQAAARGVATLGDIVHRFAILGRALIDKAPVLVLVSDEIAAIALGDLADQVPGGTLLPSGQTHQLLH